MIIAPVEYEQIANEYNLDTGLLSKKGSLDGKDVLLRLDELILADCPLRL